jgi:hypothetical protein
MLNSAASGSKIILQLHVWDVHGDVYEELGKKLLKSQGTGTLLWFEVDDFDKVLKQIRKVKPKITQDVFVNSNAQHREIWFKDPDGYVVVVASPYGDI